MHVLGINAYHGDAAACLVVDGQLVAAIEEERIRRVKHWAGLPTEAVRFCLQYAGLSLDQVDHIAVGRSPRAHLAHKAWFTLRTRPSLAMLRDRLSNRGRVRDIKGALCAALGVPRLDVGAPLHQVEHHRAHLASAYYPSGFDRAVCVSLDGFGDFVSTMVGVGHGAHIDVCSSIRFPHSLGAFYTAGTQYLGFERYGDEYKVMGLSAYGEAEYLEAMRGVIRTGPRGRYTNDLQMFRHQREVVDTQWDDGAPTLGPYYSDRWEQRFGRCRRPGEPIEDRHRNVARSLQARTEEIVFHVLKNASALAPGAPLCLAGGCAQNSVANGKIRTHTPFSELYVPPAAGDAGTAVGAALWVWQHKLGRPRCAQPAHAFLGPSYSDAEIRLALERAGLVYAWIGDEGELVLHTAERLARGEVVGWFQGRAEWGPRALGNRSLLADPRRPGMPDLLNRKIKLRESFRPFAPAVLLEQAGDWFEAAHAVPFMSEVHPLRPRGRVELPAVTHVDGTGRLQTVDRTTNPRFRRLIEAFWRRTGIPALLNTSFNENEPMVHRPEEALACFERTGLDALVLGNAVVSRDGATR